MDKNIDPVVEQILGDWLDVIETTESIPVWLRLVRKVRGWFRWQ